MAVAERGNVEKVVNEYMQKMEDKDVVGAYSLFPPMSKKSVPQSKIEELVEGQNYSIFSDFERAIDQRAGNFILGDAFGGRFEARAAELGDFVWIALAKRAGILGERGASLAHGAGDLAVVVGRPGQRTDARAVGGRVPPVHTLGVGCGHGLGLHR